jgi:hypothetical protein
MSDSANRRQASEALARVLGPEEPELSCEECFARLDHYVELTLTGAPADREVPGMRAHLDGCPACAEDFDSLRDLVRSEQGDSR